MIPVKGYRDCFVGILGLGKTGIATAKALKLGGAYPLSWDDNASSREAAELDGLEIFDLNRDDYLDKMFIYLSNNYSHEVIMKSWNNVFKGSKLDG